MKTLLTVTVVLYVLSTIQYGLYLFRQQHRTYRWARIVLVAGFVCHSVLLAALMVRSGRIPVQNLHETLVFAGWATVVVFLVFQQRYRLRVLGVYAAPLAAVTVFAASRFAAGPATEKILLNNFWLILHIAAVFIGEASFALAAGLGILYLLQENAIKTKRHGFFFRRLPSLDILDQAGYACIVFGFTLLTLGLVTGFVYAREVWGKFWSWDPKEVWSGITWLLYAALLHQRLTVGWRGRRAAVMAIVGFCAVLFTFLGVNFLLSGHHGEFTRW